MRTGIIAVLFGMYFVVCSSLFAQVPLNFNVENRNSNCKKITVASKSDNALPDPFEWENGSGRIMTTEDWCCRRNEIKTEIEYYEIGPKPDKPAVTATYSGGKLNVNITVNGKSLQLTSAVTMPSGDGPFPIVIGMNSGTGSLSQSLFSGVVQVAFTHDQVVKQNYNGSRNQNDPFYTVYPELWNKIGNYCAWSWGISRIIDGLELVKDQMKLDMSRIAVTGCSYAGKMALFAGAFDERITLTIAQESGGGGIPAWRVSKKLATSGYDCERISNTNYSWFLQSMSKLNPDNLPYDHHELIAMIAPRAFLALGNHDYNTWLCDQGGIISCMAAHEVWKSMGVGDRFGYDFSGGHQHCSAASSQVKSATAFIDKFIKGNTNTTTSITIAPPTLKENKANWIDWTTPTLLTTPITHYCSKSSFNDFNVRCFLSANDSKFTIEADGDFSYYLMNQMGQVLENGYAYNKVTIFKEYPMGIYFFKIDKEKKNVFTKLVKYK